MTDLLTRPTTGDRLASLRRAALLDSPPEEAFNRLTRLASRLLGAPVAVVALVADDRVFFKSAIGLPEPWASRRSLPLTLSFCRHVVVSGGPLIVEDARRHPVVRTSPAIRELGWIAYAGVPLVTQEGHVLGSFAVADTMPRLWSERDVALLRDLAASVMTEIRLRVALSENGAPAEAALPRDLLESSGLPIMVLSPEDERILRVNPALSQLLGHPPEMLVGRPVESLLHPDDVAAEREAMRLLLAGECGSCTLEQRYVRQDGEPAWTLATVTLAPGWDPASPWFIVALQDLSDRRRSEEVARAAEERYRAAAHANGEAVRDWDLITDRVSWNDDLRVLFGYASETLGSTAAWWYERIHPDDRERVMDGVREGIARSNGAWETEYRFRRADGSYARVRDRADLVADAAGRTSRMIGAMSDVTERYAAEDALRASDARYRLLVEEMREVLFQTDAEGHWLFLNPAWEQLTGFPVADTLGRSFLDFIHPDDSARHPALFQPLIARETDHCRHEVRFLSRDGEFRWAEVHARLVMDPSGATIGITGTLTDLTERKLAERLSAAQGKLLEDIAAGVGLEPALERIVRFTEEHGSGFRGSIMLLDPERQVLRLVTGPSLPQSFRDALGEMPLGFATSGTAAAWREPAMLRELATDPLVESWRELALAAGVRAGWSAPISGADDSVLGTVAIYYPEPREPTPSDLRLIGTASHLAGIAIERERNLEALQRTTRLLQQVLDTLPVGVWVLGADGQIVFGNPAGREIWGGARSAGIDRFDQYRGWWAETGQPIKAEEWAAVRAVRKGEVSLNELVTIEAFDGAPKTILNSAVPIRGSDGEILGAIVTNQDVSVQRAAEEALRLSEEQLRHAHKMEAVGQLAGGIAHDFNNLLTGILSYCDLVLQELRQGDPLRADIEQIRHAGQRAAALTRQLLAFSRRQVLQPKVLSLNAAAGELDAMLRRVLGADIVLDTELDPALWYIMADPGQIEQVVVNLVVNARDAMPRGGRVTIATANLQLHAGTDQRANSVRPGSYVTLSVSDNGLGMDLATQARIFEPFFTTRDPGKGTGLGLATVYGIVEQSGGHIAVESAPGRGATFTISFPRYLGPGAPGSPEAGDRRGLPQGTETLLLVEDEAAVRSSARRLLERHGYTVLEARHGADALRIVEGLERPVDLVLTDLVMPEMGGQELVERLRARHPTLKVIYLSGYTEKAITTGGMMPDATGFVEKPFTVEQLMRRVREILDG